MLKKLFIACLFFAAYTVVLAHSIIPHNDENETATEHQHDKDHHDDNDDNGLGQLFSHFQHIGSTNQFVSTHQPVCIKQIVLQEPDIAFVNFFRFNFSGLAESIQILFPDQPFFNSSSGGAVFALRGPPSITV